MLHPFLLWVSIGFTFLNSPIITILAQGLRGGSYQLKKRQAIAAPQFLHPKKISFQDCYLTKRSSFQLLMHNDKLHFQHVVSPSIFAWFSLSFSCFSSSSFLYCLLSFSPITFFIPSFHVSKVDILDENFSSQIVLAFTYTFYLYFLLFCFKLPC